jgi:predicted phosphodiesterase
MKLVIISDTHGMHSEVKVPSGDVLIHCGDCTNDIGQRSLREFLTWFEDQPAPRKILIAGNHDGAFEKWSDLARAMVKEMAPSVIYLQDSGIEIGGVKFWGSPVQPEFFNWHFNRKRGADIKRHWDMIPNDVDVLITHGPMAGILDKDFHGESAGCKDLLDAVLRVRPNVHCCGHIHYSYGQCILNHTPEIYTKCFNASACGEDYKPTNVPFTYDL